MKKYILLVSGLFLGACASAGPYAKFYKGVDITTTTCAVVSQEKPKLIHGFDPQDGETTMLEDGYGMVGYSSFYQIESSSYGRLASSFFAILSKQSYLSSPGTTVNMNGALVQAKKVHAAIVLVYKINHLNSDKVDYVATYWIKLKPPVFGAITLVQEEMPPEMRQKIQKGILVFAVVKNSPAFRADIVKGDIILKIGDVELYDKKSFNEAISKYSGQTTIVEMQRDGKALKKEIQFDVSSTPCKRGLIFLYDQAHF